MIDYYVEIRCRLDGAIGVLYTLIAMDIPAVSSDFVSDAIAKTRAMGYEFYCFECVELHEDLGCSECDQDMDRSDRVHIGMCEDCAYTAELNEIKNWRAYYEEH